MSEYIGLKSLHEHIALRQSPFTLLKREALLFDQIGIFDLDSLLDACYIWESNKRRAEAISLSSEQLTDAHWLVENGVIFDARLSFHPEKMVSLVANAENYQSLLKLYSKGTDKLLRYSLASLTKISEEERNTIAREYLFHQTIMLRLTAIEIEAERRAVATPLLSYSEYFREIPKSQNVDVIQIVIENLPMPGVNTPWEQILDFRKDPENQKNLLSLRRWIRKIASEKLNPSELEDELHWLMNEFESQMNLHKMKANTETIEACIKAPLEILEDIVKIKWSKIPEPFFAFKKRKISLLESEMSSSGKEIAYLVKANETFGDA